ncbi:hypothetical protein ACIGHJ_00810 [Stutzerimonas kunmingensis]|uniref:hypothetical protein n=1 Tax=Stutzerimonas stutzeri subgroup TaxID=578833 RepID=UPI000A9DA171|nr:hypothetical protein [Stutzerimonas stutzeri]
MSLEVPLNIFCVSTPLQFLNAIEACHALSSLSTGSVLFVLAKHPEHMNTWLCVQQLHDLPFTEVHLVALDNVSLSAGVWKVFQSFWGNRVRATGLAARYLECSRFFVGNPRTREHIYLASLFPNAKITILDDGTGTVSFFEKVQVHGGKAAAADFVSGGLIPWLKECCFRLFYGAYRKPLSKADFFTTHALEAEAAGYDAVKNNYDWLASTMRVRPRHKGTHFLGAPFVERGELPWEVYLAWLQSALRSLPAPVTYVAHWAESDEFLGRLESELGISCVRFERPYELEFLLGDQEPACVASWFSSALDVLSSVSGHQARLIAVEVPFNDFLKADIAASARAFYERHRVRPRGVEVIRWMV